jgi:cytoskeletal protein CcmA (bactofilin family)
MKSFLGSARGNGGSTGVDSLIGRQTEVLGDVRFSGGLHLDGKIKGNVSAGADKTATLSVGETGAIEGDVRVPSIVLNGSVIGDVYAGERLSLSSRAKVTGNVHYKVLEMESGAVVNGQVVCQAAGSLPALEHQPAPKSAAEPVLVGLDSRRTRPDKA